ncbi:hypothetical protein CPB83DRAFT_907055 [Crepidotus variabilis]|uniref:F-box domain-containing protein n=1 Tax=Crepidotus variabilis TaxID=179855 RepID=A0A9P6JPS7_9AGAR|nr:hypothetical protein CPB83DRAFT_907055 [Crepidotus variabilis]
MLALTDTDNTESDPSHLPKLILCHTYEPQPSNLARRGMARKQANYLTVTAMHLYREGLRGLIRHRSLDSSLLMRTPIDILFEIFRNLHPIDLAHLRSASLIFDETINCIGNILWKASFDELASEMSIPSGISASKWAHLLFGPSICEECGAVHAPFNVVHSHRLCHECHSRRFVHMFAASLY